MKNWGGHFTPELGGHFELESGGHFKLELGGQYHWNLHLWCKEKPIRFLYTFIVLVILYFIAESQQYHYQIL